MCRRSIAVLMEHELFGSPDVSLLAHQAIGHGRCLCAAVSRGVCCCAVSVLCVVAAHNPMCMLCAAPCSATRAVCALAEARAHAVAAARTPADRAALLGGDEMQLYMEQLEDRMHLIASNAGACTARGCGSRAFVKQT